MTCAACGCNICGGTTSTCGCCEGVQVLTPHTVHNRPGLSTLSYRVGTHGAFLATMKARLSTMEVDGPGPDGQMLAGLRPLNGLTTRDPGDPSIALLDAWAAVGDVLSFYQERNANEAYLRTATERRSVLELSRLVGYRLRPGVAATAYLAYTLDDNQKEPVTIAAGARSQSVPDPDETAQTFETSEDLLAQREWNNLRVRLKQPHNITLGTALSTATINVAGINTNLKPGDKLLLVFSDDGSTSVVRSVAAVDTQFADQRSVISLQPVDPLLLDCLAKLVGFLAANAPGTTAGDVNVLKAGQAIVDQVYLGLLSPPAAWAPSLEQMDTNPSASFTTALKQLDTDIQKLLKLPSDSSGLAVTDPAVFVQQLLKPAVPQFRNSVSLPRSLTQAFVPPGSLIVKSKLPAAGGTAPGVLAPSVKNALVFSDAGTQLLVNFVPHLEQSYYTAWAGARLNAAQAPLKGVFALRDRTALFGATASKLPAYSTGDVIGVAAGLPPGVLLPPNLWKEDWPYDDDEEINNAFLAQANEAIAVGSYVLADVAGKRQVLRVGQASATPRSAYGLSGPSTKLVFDAQPKEGWRTVSDATGARMKITDLRHTQFYVHSEPLTLVDQTITDLVGSEKNTEIDRQTPELVQLDGLYKGLVSGRWVIFSGERGDIDGVDGVKVSELQMLSGLRHGFDPLLPGDQIHTTLTLAKGLAYRYKRDTLTIYGNVVKATHGETRKEVLGSGDGAQSLQSFTLKQPPLTFVAAPTVAGAESTLHVRVNDVEWHESESLAWLGAKDRGFVTLTDDAGATTLSFGNGVHGARLPTGVQNVGAVYRNGIGKGGNVKAWQIKLLQTRPLGVKEVINPLRASGGADKESRDLARENAPLTVMPLDRLISVQDYADFTRRFAGIAKALALRTSDGRQQLVYLTIAGVDDIPIDATSDLYLNLLDALRKSGDADVPLRVDMRELKALVLSANVKLMPDYQWDAVAKAVRQRLLDSFGFDKRALGQPALLCEVIAAMQNVRGVSYVDVDAFGAVPQSTPAGSGKNEVPGTRHLLSQEDIVQAVRQIVSPDVAGRISQGPVESLPPDVDAWPGGSDNGVLRPAELAVFMPAVTDTLVLNQIP